jgi:hypothetical protein
MLKNNGNKMDFMGSSLPGLKHGKKKNGRIEHSSEAASVVARQNTYQSPNRHTKIFSSRGHLRIFRFSRLTVGRQQCRLSWSLTVQMKTLHELVADKLAQANPESRTMLLQIPLDNIDRWLANGHAAPKRLENWRQLLLRAQASPEGFQELLTLLSDPSESARRLKDFAPFAGVLSWQERQAAIPECAYNF